MNEPGLPDQDILHDLRWHLRLTQWGMVAERGVRCFWQVWTAVLSAVALTGFGFHSLTPAWLAWATFAALAGLAARALWTGACAFRWPNMPEAVRRLDRTLPGQPLAALADRVAETADGGDGAGRAAVWQAHRQRMVERALHARPVWPDLRLSAADPFALRYLAVTGAIMALAFGSFAPLSGFGPAGGAPSASWEGWADPPDYTGQPGLYLNDQPPGPLTLPKGTRLTLRLYGDAAALTLLQSLGPSAPAGDQGDRADLRVEAVTVEKGGTLAIQGDGGREWQVLVASDAPPTIAPTAPMRRRADGSMQQAFHATDDYGIASGTARFTLNLDQLPRRYGLAVPPDALAPLVVDLPRPKGGQARDMTATLEEDASDSVLANLPVTMVLTAKDGAGQTAESQPQSIILPGRRFFDPLAAALVEVRRDLLWSRANGPRSLALLKALSNRPQGFITDDGAYILIRTAITRLDAALAQGALQTPARDDVASALWQAALRLEDGGLSDALERMRRAEERLSQAIRNGADPEEVRRLMDELRAATDAYVAMLAERDAKGQGDQVAGKGPMTSLTADQLAQLMKRIEDLMNQGRQSEAQALLDQFAQMMENLKVVQGQGGGPGQQALWQMQKTLRDQQGLSDQTFREGQQSDGETDAGRGRRDQLADRQRDLRDALRQGQGTLPDTPGAEDDAARKLMDDAGRAMDQAEEALRKDDLRGAIDKQAEALGKLRQGLKGMNDALAGSAGRNPDQGDGQGLPGAAGKAGRDPLGRDIGATDDEGALGSDADRFSRQARDLMDRIRRRLEDTARPDGERDYLRRLLGGP